MREGGAAPVCLTATSLGGVRARALRPGILQRKWPLAQALRGASCVKYDCYHEGVLPQKCLLPRSGPDLGTN